LNTYNIYLESEMVKMQRESNSMFSFADFYQFPLNEENIEKYGKDYQDLSLLPMKPGVKGLMLVDRYDQVAGYIRVDERNGDLKNLHINPIYRRQGLGSKLLDTEIGRQVKSIFVDPKNVVDYSFFSKNGFKDHKKFDLSTLMVRDNGLREDLEIFEKMEDEINNIIDDAIDELDFHDDIVNETENYLNYLVETSVAGVAAPAMLAKPTLRKCPNMFDYDEFYETEESNLVCSKEDARDPIDVASSIPDRNRNSSSYIKKPQVMMEEENFIIEDNVKKYPIYIVCIEGNTLFGRSIQKVTNSVYSHASISFDSNLSKCYSYNFNLIDGMDGFNIENLTSYKSFTGHISSFKQLLYLKC